MGVPGRGLLSTFSVDHFAAPFAASPRLHERIVNPGAAWSHLENRKHLHVSVKTDVLGQHKSQSLPFPPWHACVPVPRHTE